MGFCGKCGAPIGDRDPFCGNCGTPTKKPSAPSGSSQDIFNAVMSNLLSTLSTPRYSDSSSSEAVECLKCGAISGLTVFNHSERISSSFFEGKNTTKVTTKSINIPLCYECNDELTEWKNNHSNEKNSMTDNVCLNLCGLIILAVAAFVWMVVWVVGIMIFVFILEGIYITYRRTIKNQPNSGFRYVKFRGSQTYVRPRGTGPWIRYQKWLNSF